MTKVEKKTNPPASKRKVASVDECRFDLKNELPVLFKSFNEAFQSYEKEVIMTRPEARARGFEASLLNSKMIESIQNNFPTKWKFGRYRRFTLRINGYIVLFKKLNKADRPMNIRTKSVDAISNQHTLPLFDDSTFRSEPILFFGYRKDSFGNITDPKLVYIDEDKVKWTISGNEITTEKPITIPIETGAVPVLKQGVGKQKKTAGSKK